jgi:hypothetical protein
LEIETKKKTAKEYRNNDFVCPECGDNDCLIDKHGKKYPCLSCIQIDIGQKIMKNISKVVDRNNMLIEKLCGIFTPKEDSNND